MAQYVGDISNVLQTAQSIGNQLAQSQQTGIEQARVNAANYLQNLRNDAEKAGYSVAQWAKMNETGVKNALFHLSGMNNDVTEQKYQELINGPTSGDQRLQEYKDQFLEENDPGSLFGTAPKTETQTEVIKGSPAKEAMSIPINDFRQKIKEGNYSDILSAGKALFGEDADLSYQAHTPESEAYWKWRKSVARAYGMNDYTGSPEQNKALLKMILAGNPTNEIQIEGTGGDLTPELEANLSAIVSDKNSFRPGNEKAVEAIKTRLETDPSYKEGVKKAALEIVKNGNKIPISGSPFSNWTPELFESLFEKGTPGGTYRFEGNLPNIDFSFSGTPDKTVTKTVEVEPGKPGYIDLLNSMNERLLDAGSLGDPELYKLKQDQEKLQASINESKSATDRNKASSQLMQVQALQLMNAANSIPGIPKERVTAFNKNLESFYKDFPADKLSKLLKDPNTRAAYEARIKSLSSEAAGIGIGMDLRSLVLDSWLPFGIGNIKTMYPELYYGVFTNPAGPTDTTRNAAEQLRSN